MDYKGFRRGAGAAVSGRQSSAMGGDTSEGVNLGFSLRRIGASGNSAAKGVDHDRETTGDRGARPTRQCLGKG